MAIRTLRRHGLSSLVTTLGGALALVQILVLTSLNSQSYSILTIGAPGYQAVVGPRGSALQLVLSSVFHLDTSSGNLPWSVFEEVRKTPGVLKAIPLATGDSYHGFRVVGTLAQAFTEPPSEGVVYRFETGGRVFDMRRREAIIGSFVASASGLKLGDRFNPTHGFDQNGHEHEEEYVVVGILQPTNTPMDRVLWIPLEGILRMQGHVLRGHGETFEPQPGEAIPEEHIEISAILCNLASPQVGFQMDERYNRLGTSVTVAYPIGRVVAEVYAKFGWAQQLLHMVTVVTMVVAATSILATVYNTVQERQRDFAIYRALGMPRRTLIWLLLLESSLIGIVSVLVALPVYSSVMLLLGHWARIKFGIVLSCWSYTPALLWAPLGTIGLSIVAGILPALKAYRTDVANILNS